MTLIEIGFLVLGALGGALSLWLWHRGALTAAVERARGAAAVEIATLNERLSSSKAEVEALRSESDRIRTQLETSRNEAQTLREHNARLATASEGERKQAGEKLKLLLEARESLTEQFQNLANRIFEEKGDKLVQQNIANLDSLLKPLGERLKDFQGRVEETYDKESKQRFSLQTEIQRLVELNTKISEDAVNLTNALKGNSKTQGSWGELILERALEASGLQKGREYEVQVNVQRDDGTKGQPDVIVQLPEDKQVVIDSKVSLTAYEAYCSTGDEATRARELARHVESVKRHVEMLADKNYQGLPGLRALDLVLMFVPVEPALILAAQADRDLFLGAIKKRVMIVSPTTLLMSLQVIASVWRYEHQNRNAQELVRHCGTLYDKFVGFVADLEDVGKKIEAAERGYEEAYSKLKSGKGNLIRQAERIRELGIKPAKSLPPHIVELAMDDEIEADAEVQKLPAPKAGEAA